MYKLLLFLHIFSAVLSIGPYFVLFPLLKKMRTIAEEQIDPLLDLFRYVVRSTMHAGHLLVITGVLLVWKGNWSWHSPWLVIPLTILLGSAFFIARAFTPNIRKYREQKIDRVELVAKLTRANLLYIAILLLSLWFMVVKPALWA